MLCKNASELAPCKIEKQVHGDGEFLCASETYHLSLDCSVDLSEEVFSDEIAYVALFRVRGHSS